MSMLDRFVEKKVQVALGCTEPIAVALATAKARSVVDGEVRKIEVLVDPNIFKNGMGAGIPGTDGRTGNILAAALGALCGDPNACLQVLKNVHEEAIARALTLIEGGSVVLEVLRGRRGIFIDARVITDQGIGRARIQDEHTNLTILERNGVSVLDAECQSGKAGPGEDFFEGLRFVDLVAEADGLSTFAEGRILEAVRANAEVADYGLSHDVGLGLGKALQKAVDDGLLGDDAANRAKILTAAAVDARMGGAPVGVTAVAGSGNQGLACTMPLLAFCRVRGLPIGRKLAEATALAFLTTGYIKGRIGSLGAMCGCVVAAGAGAAAGITRLLGGDAEACARAVTNILADLAGVICDGAKGGCSLKLTTAANASIQAAVLAIEGLRVTPKDGIVVDDVDETIGNLGRLSHSGMTVTDDVILDIMIDKLKQGAYS